MTSIAYTPHGDQAASENGLNILVVIPEEDASTRLGHDVNEDNTELPKINFPQTVRTLLVHTQPGVTPSFRGHGLWSHRWAN